MNGVDAIGSAAGLAAQVFAPAQAAPAVEGASGSPASAAAASGDTATEYQMSVLSKAMYASADQALALLQMLPQPASPLR